MIRITNVKVSGNRVLVDQDDGSTLELEFSDRDQVSIEVATVISAFLLSYQVRWNNPSKRKGGAL